MNIFAFLYLFAAFGTSIATLSFPGNGPKPGDFAYPPEGFENEELGSILRSREIDFAELGMFKVQAKAYQLLYRTSGVNISQPMAAVTTVIVPQTHEGDKLIIAATPEDASSFKCSPSFQLVNQHKLNIEGLVSRFESLLYDVYLQKGWVVTVPDYEGPMSAFGVGKLNGYAMLDAARASLRWNKSELSKNSKVQAVGYSGGAIATGWTAALQPSYAPELNAVGFAFGGTPSDLSALIEKSDNSGNSGLIILGTAGILNAYPHLEPVLKECVTDKFIKHLKIARENCVALATLASNFDHIQSSDYIKTDNHTLASLPGVKDLLDELVMGADSSVVPKAPVFMWHAKTDDVIPYNAAKKSAEKWCKNGANINFLTETFPTPHIGAYIATFAKLVRYIEDRFAGKNFIDGCKFDQDASPAFNLDDDITFVKDIVEIVKTIFGEATDERLR